jgi:hypothetical protein
VINHIFQPPESSLCGQTCVAMIAGITIEESIVAFGGTRRGTRTKQLVEALRKLGVKCGDAPLTRIPKTWQWDDLPKTCIVKLHFEWTKTTHWTLWHNNRFYDPTEEANNLIYLGIAYPQGVRLTSYLPIFME